MKNPTFPDNEVPLIFNYRSLKASYFVTLLWLGLVVLCITLIRLGGYQMMDVNFQVLAAASVFSVIFSMHSLNSSGGPFIIFHEEHLQVNHTYFRKITLNYKDITNVFVANEEIEIHRRDFSPVVINLAMLSFEDQERCLGIINRLFTSVMEPL